MKQNLLKPAILLLAILIVCLALLFVKYQDRPIIKSIHVLNLEKDIDKWRNMQTQASRLGLHVERFSGFDGSKLDYNTIPSYGVGRSMIRPNRKDNKLVNLGTVGCFLAHRNLLTHLASQPYSDSAGHMILEDDLKLPDDFLQPGGRWSKYSKVIPGSYDIILCGLWHPYGTKLSNEVYKLKTDLSKRSNLGTFCYIVRHGALKTKILPWLKYMIDAYDEQLAMKYVSWESYAIKPNLVDFEESYESSVNLMNELH